MVFSFIFLSPDGVALTQTVVPTQTEENATAETKGGPSFETSEPAGLRNTGLFFYNQGIQILQQGREERAVPFLQKSFYQYFLPSAYKTLSRLKRAPSLKPLLWHITAGIYGLLSVFLLLFFLIKKPLPFLWKAVPLWFCGVGVLAGSGFSILKKRAGALEEIRGLSAPVKELEPLWTAPAGEDVIVLKKRDAYFQVRTKQGKTGWVEAKSLLPTLQ